MGSPQPYLTSLRALIWSRPAAAGVLLALGLVSCRTVPPPLPGEAHAIPARYQASLPLHFDSRQTLVFAFRPHWWWPPVRIAALGYSVVDRPAQEYAIACLSPLGMKLFDLSRSKNEVHARFSIPLPGDPETVEKAIDSDMTDLYFALTPPPDAVVTRQGAGLIFRSSNDHQQLEYVYSLADGQLLSKTRRKGRHKVNTIVFSDYRAAGTKSYPATSVLHNFEHGYTLTLTVQSYHSREAAP
jgi:hypothetical protein